MAFHASTYNTEKITSVRFFDPENGRVSFSACPNSGYLKFLYDSKRTSLEAAYSVLLLLFLFFSSFLICKTRSVEIEVSSSA